MEDPTRKGWSHSNQNATSDLVPIEKWGYDKNRLREDVDRVAKGVRDKHLWGERGADYEREKEKRRGGSSSSRRREKSKSPERRRRRQS